VRNVLLSSCVATMVLLEVCGTEWLARGPRSIFTRFGRELESYLRQSATEAENGFVCSTLDQTQGFTHAGIE